MNLYVRTMNCVIDHIEKNICAQLTLQSVAQEFHLIGDSSLHFYH